MNNNWFEQGEKADSLYNKKEYQKAEKAYHTLLKTIHKSGELDLFLISKITLGLLLTYIKTEEYEKAFEIWTSDPEVNIFGLGISGLSETFQVSAHDTMVYYQVYGYLYTMVDDEPDALAERIGAVMQMIIRYARESEPEMIDRTMSNWKQYISIVFDQMIPEKYSKPVSDIEEELGTVYPLLDIDFSQPSAWVIDWEADKSVIDGR